MILSVPLIAIMRIVCQNLEHPYARCVHLFHGRGCWLPFSVPVARSTPKTSTHPLHHQPQINNNSVAVRIMEGRLLDFDDQGYVPTPKKGESTAARQRQRRRREQRLEGGDGGQPLSSGGGQLRRRHVEAPAASPIPPAIAPIGVAPASAGGGGGK